jgi:hypothetical protein
MHIVTHAKKGGKSRKKTTRSMFEETKTRAVAAVMRNLSAEALAIEMNAVQQVLEAHLGRPIVAVDVPKIDRVYIEGGYVLRYDGKPLGDITRFNYSDQKSETNYKVVFTPYE